MIKRCSQDDFTKGSIFHIYNKTMQSLKLFYTDNDYLWFLQRFGNVLNNYSATIFAYCLMPNHFHFLIRQDSEKPLYSLFNHSLSPYVRHLNYKLKRKGPIFQEKLQHIKIFNAIRNRNSKKAGEAMFEHLSKIERILVREKGFKKNK